jgi:hypothetical protein
MFSPEDIFIIVVVAVIIWFLFLRRRHHQQQQQQQVVIHGEAHDKKRVCPKCGWQNDRESKFCSDCGFKFGQ